jgi:biopolymer transport protein ExbD
VLVGGEEVAIEGLKPILFREKQLLERLERNPREATVIIRADADSKTGQVQELIKDCQEIGFEKFVLRAKQREA